MVTVLLPDKLSLEIQLTGRCPDISLQEFKDHDTATGPAMDWRPVQGAPLASCSVVAGIGSRKPEQEEVRIEDGWTNDYTHHI